MEIYALSGELTAVFVPPAVQVISAELRSSKRWELTGEGTEIAEQGSHEARVFSSIPLEGLAQSELMVSATGGQVRWTTVGVTHTHTRTHTHLYCTLRLSLA